MISRSLADLSTCRTLSAPIFARSDSVESNFARFPRTITDDEFPLKGGWNAYRSIDRPIDRSIDEYRALRER